MLLAINSDNNTVLENIEHIVYNNILEAVDALNKI